MLSKRDQAIIVQETCLYMASELTRRGLDGKKVTVNGYYQVESATVVLVVNDRKKGSRRSPVPARTLARCTVTTDPDRRSGEIASAVDFVERHLRKKYPDVLTPTPQPERVPVQLRPPPTEEDLEEVRRIFRESRERRSRRPSKPPGGASGTQDRTTGSS